MAPRLREALRCAIGRAVGKPFAPAGRICSLLSAPRFPFLCSLLAWLGRASLVTSAGMWSHLLPRRLIEFRATHGSNADAKARRAKGGRAPA
jgi:hypothetical protein